MVSFIERVTVRFGHSFDQIGVHLLEVPSPAHFGEEIDNRCAGVEDVQWAEFRSGVVPREGVMVVVEALTKKQVTDRRFDRGHFAVVGSGSVEVGPAIDLGMEPDIVFWN